jgi:hypothetical protein
LALAKRQFLDWCVGDRFGDGLTTDELETYARNAKLPEPILNRLESTVCLPRGIIPAVALQMHWRAA